MTETADKIRNRYVSGHVSIVVQGWEDVFPDGEIRCKPMTVGGLKRLDDLAERTDPASRIEVLIRLAEGPDGRPLFSDGDRETLTECLDMRTLAHITDRMLGIEG